MACKLFQYCYFTETLDKYFQEQLGESFLSYKKRELSNLESVLQSACESKTSFLSGISDVRKNRIEQSVVKHHMYYVHPQKWIVN